MRIGKQKIEHSRGSDERDQGCSEARHSIDAEPLPGTEITPRDATEEESEAETHARKDQAVSMYSEMKRSLGYVLTKQAASGSHLDTLSAANTAERTSIVVDPPTAGDVRTLHISIESFPDFWEDHKSRIYSIIDDRHEFYGDQVLRAGEYLRMLQDLRNTVKRYYSGCDYEHDEYPRQLVVTFLYLHETEVATEADTDVEELCTDPGRSLGLSSSCKDKESTENDRIGRPTASSCSLRPGTPFPGCEYSNSDKENWQCPTRSKKRGPEALGSGQDRKRRKGQKGASPQDPVDLTGDVASNSDENDAV